MTLMKSLLGKLGVILVIGLFIFVYVEVWGGIGGNSVCLLNQNLNVSMRRMKPDTVVIRFKQG
jgi:hypothetical protein